MIKRDMVQYVISVLVFSVWPAIDTPSLTGAVFGTLFFLTQSVDLSGFQKVVYIPTSLLIGYFGAISFIAKSDLFTNGFIPAVVLSTLSILVLIKFISILDSLNLEKIMDIIKSIFPGGFK